MKKLLITALILLMISLLSACQSESRLAKSQAIVFLESQGYTDIVIIGEITVENECSNSFHEKGYEFQGAFQWVDLRTHHVTGVVCGGEYNGTTTWSSAAGEMAVDLPEDSQ